MRGLKTATWVCIGLLVGAEIFARSPLSIPLKGGIDEQAILKERKAQTAGPANELPGLRPFPSYYDLELGSKPDAPKPTQTGPSQAPTAGPSTPLPPSPPSATATPPAPSAAPSAAPAPPVSAGPSAAAPSAASASAPAAPAAPAAPVPAARSP